MTNCTYCDKPCSTENSNSCTNCNDCIHHKCLFNADMLPSAWTNNNTPPQYACAIFNSKNFYFIVIIFWYLKMMFLPLPLILSR